MGLNVVQRVSDLRRTLSEIDGALRDTPEMEHRASGDVDVLQEPFGEAASRIEARTLDSSATDDESDIGGDPLIIVELPPEVERDEATPLISMERAKEIRARIAVQGTDALGWYVTFHQTAYQWGAYLSDDGIRFLADPVHGVFGGLKTRACRQLLQVCTQRESSMDDIK